MCKNTHATYIREHRQNTFVKLSRFWLLRGWGGGGQVSESVKKENRDKNLFFQMLNEFLKICEK